jgi:integrase
MELKITEGVFRRRGHEPKPVLFYRDENGERRHKVLQNIEGLTGMDRMIAVAEQAAALRATLKQKQEIEKTYVKKVVPKKGEASPYKHKTLAELLTLFADDAAHNRGIDNVQHLVRRIERVIKDAGIKTVAELETGRVQKAISKMVTLYAGGKKNGTGMVRKGAPKLSEESKNHYRKAMRRFGNFLVEKGVVDKNPLVGMIVSKSVQMVRPRGALTATEMETLTVATYRSEKTIEGLDGAERAWLYRLANLTGLRRKELGALTQASFFLDDLNSAFVVLPNSSTKNREGAALALHPQMAEKLRDWLATREQVIFPGLAGKKTWKMVRDDLKAAKIPELKNGEKRDFHSFRHAFGTSLQMAGAPQALAQKMLRHKTPAMTQRYFRKPDGAEHAAVSRVAVPGLEVF